MAVPKKTDTPGAPRAPQAAGARTTVPVPRAWLVGLSIAVVLPWIILGGVYLAGGTASRIAPAGDMEAHPAAAAQAASGPWGQLTMTPIVVSPPIEYVAADWGRVTGGEWRFPGVTREMLASFLTAAGFTGEQISTLQSQARADPQTGGLVIAPDPALVRALTQEQRARLYSQLAKTTLNPDQVNAFSFSGTSVDEWLAGSSIAPQTRQLIEPLIYRHDGFMHFADAGLVHALIADPLEKQRLAKVLLRQATMLVRLTVRDAAEVTQLAEYWGRGGRATDVRPLLESVAGTGGDSSIDVVHLLPSFARNRLYRYPKLTTADLDKPLLANCLWTALNFFRAEPDDRFLDVATALSTLRREYYIVENTFRLGDIVALLDTEGNLFHVAVYLADDLVFTKNGTSPVSPWIIMPNDRLEAFYASRAPNPRLIHHRRSDF